VVIQLITLGAGVRLFGSMTLISGFGSLGGHLVVQSDARSVRRRQIDWMGEIDGRRLESRPSHDAQPPVKFAVARTLHSAMQYA
jgi:hypothetical protein